MIIVLAKHELEVPILASDQILPFIFYIILAILEFYPEFFLFDGRKEFEGHQNCT
jgi:hypothetical protein